jgi:dTDP-4-amino-4,6-dideoxygalactose transaminase
MIDIASPLLGDEERQAVLEVMASGRLIQGPRVEAFEAAFAARHGARHAVATSSGATALTAALLGHGIGHGDEVIVPSFSFFATAAAVLGVGATPVFADIDPESFCLAPAAAAAAISPRTKALMPVHLYGLPADMESFERLCARHGLCLLEDAAQAHGARIGERSVGSFGTAVFSFNATKNMTTGEGGMVLTSDDSLAERLRALRNHGRGNDGRHAVVGSNFRMTELAAAIGTVQLGRLARLTEARRENARHFERTLTGVAVPREPAGRTHVYHQFTVRVPAGQRERVLAGLHERGIGARVYYATPIHRQPALAANGRTGAGDLLETERASREVLSIPVHPRLTLEERAAIVAALNALTA